MPAPMDHTSDIGEPPCHPFGKKGPPCPEYLTCMFRGTDCKAYRMYENSGEGNSPRVLAARGRLIRPLERTLKNGR